MALYINKTTLLLDFIKNLFVKEDANKLCGIINDIYKDVIYDIYFTMEKNDDVFFTSYTFNTDKIPYIEIKVLINKNPKRIHLKITNYLNFYIADVLIPYTIVDEDIDNAIISELIKKYFKNTYNLSYILNNNDNVIIDIPESELIYYYHENDITFNVNTMTKEYFILDNNASIMDIEKIIYKQK